MSDKNQLGRGLQCAGILVLIAFSAPPEVKSKAPVTVSFSLRSSNVSLHEPVYVDFAAINQLTEAISFDLGFDRKQGFSFSITQPDGSTVLPPRYERGGIGRGGGITLEAGGAYGQSILLNELFQAAKPGEYWITVGLVARIRTHSGQTVAPPPPEKIRLNVAPRDPRRLADVCERLARAATGADYEAAREATFALRYVPDPAAIPYLERVITEADWTLRGLAVTGLARIATPQAVEILKSHLNTSDPTLKSQIDTALWEIKTGSKVEVLD